MSYVAETEKDYGVVRDQMIMMLDILFTRIMKAILLRFPPSTEVTAQ